MSRKNIILAAWRGEEGRRGGTGEEIVRGRRREKISGFAKEMNQRKMNYLINCVCVHLLFVQRTEIIKLSK